MPPDALLPSVVRHWVGLVRPISEGCAFGREQQLIV
jgi:hypothetical protein